MVRNWALVGTALVAALIATAAEANSTRYRQYGIGHSGYYPGYYTGYYSGGYWAHSQRHSRPGPRYGYKFGWASYRGDPFAGQDYFDGRNCYYTYDNRDYCLGPRWRGGFRW